MPNLRVTRLGQVAARLVGSKSGVGQPLGLVSADKQQPEHDEEDIEQDVEAEVGSEALLVSGCVGLLEDLQ